MRVVQVCKSARFSMSRTNPFEEVLRALPADEKLFIVLSGGVEGVSEGVADKVESLRASKKEMKARRLSLLLRLWRALKKFQPDVIVAHRVTPTVLVALLQIFFPGCRRVCFIHGQGQLRKWRRRLFARLFLRRWTFVAVSDAVRNDLVRSGVRESQLVVIRNAVDIDSIQAQALSRGEARSRLGIGKDVFVVGTVGRLHPVKDQKSLIKAAALSKHPWHVVILGGGSLAPELERMASGAGMRERVTLPGEKPDAFQYLRAYDVFVLPSLSEGLPLALIEAIALGVPSLGTPVGGIPEVLINSQWIVPVQNPPALGLQIDELVERGPLERKELAAQQYEYLKDQFSVKRFHQEIAQLIHGVDA